MKNIIIELNFSPSKNYLIHLGGQEWLNFKSKHFVEEFIRKYKSVLIDNIRYLSSFQSEIYQLYRNYYFVFDDRTERQILASLHNFDDRFGFIFQEYSKGNQNAFSFNNISYCFATAVDTLSLMKDFAKVYKEYSLKNQVFAKLKILIELEKIFEIDKHSLIVNESYKNDSQTINFNKISKTA